MPRLEVEHRGVVLTELDTDAVLARKPEVVLVDELAHTKAPGVDHEKRWEDVDSLLDAGIDVITRPEWDASPEVGRFARIHDPEGNPIELWQPPAG